MLETWIKRMLLKDLVEYSLAPLLDFFFDPPSSVFLLHFLVTWKNSLHVCTNPFFAYIAKLFVAKRNLFSNNHSCIGENSQRHPHKNQRRLLVVSPVKCPSIPLSHLMQSVTPCCLCPSQIPLSFLLTSLPWLMSLLWSSRQISLHCCCHALFFKLYG